ncbi:MAG: prepilin-type N-terminal cleavage/methylation domain-containing protein [Candidatus Sumerlaeota bacterium]|nr:prepilin-type N-terminal cleavage/methylation domain-containing protein [Candidatus Sumerlaeota bacterium]
MSKFKDKYIPSDAGARQAVLLKARGSHLDIGHSLLDIGNCAFPRRSARSRAVTLFELLVAMTILAIVLSSLYVTLRTSMRAYQEGMRDIGTLQTIRYLTDFFTRDTRSIHYENYYNYNQEYRRKLMERARLMDQRRRDGLPDDAINNPAWADPLGYNPLEFMYKIDLAFRGTAQSVTFVRYQPTLGDTATQPWGLARVTYEFNSGDKTVVRKEEPIFDKNKTQELQAYAVADAAAGYASANPPSSDTPAGVSEVVAENVVGFSLRYGYYSDGQWYEAAQWESGARRWRNPPLEYIEDDLLAEQIRTFNFAVPVDDLPAYIDADITVAEAGGARTMLVRHMVTLPPGVETYTPIHPNFATAGYSRFHFSGNERRR